MPEGEENMNMGVVDREVKALAERAGSPQKAKMRELGELLVRRDQLEKGIEGGFRYVFLDHIPGFGKMGRVLPNRRLL